MKTLSALIYILCIPFALFSQTSPDISDTNKPMPDSVKSTWNKVDSIRNEFNVEADSINTQYRKSVSGIGNERAKAERALDSLERLNLSTSAIGRRIDSLDQKRDQVEIEFNSKLDQVKSKTVNRIDRVEMTPEMEGPVGEFRQEINNYSVSTEQFQKITPLHVPGYSLPEGVELGQLTELTQVTQIETPIGDIQDITQQAKGVSGDIQNLSAGNINEVEQIPQSIEQQATRIDGMEQIKNSSAAVDELKGNVTNMNNPDALKEQAAQMATKEVINHFAGKEEQLQSAMSSLSKYKKKYQSFQSLKDVNKIKRNSLKGKSFTERFRPGVYLQFQVRNGWLLDVNPYGSYLINKKVIGGLGWNQRFAYDQKPGSWLGSSRIYGPRGFVDFQLGKGFILHLEQEAMYTFVPSNPKPNTDNGHREWVFSTMLGLKKQYKIYKNLNGTVLIQYNLTNQYFKTPYLDRLNSRMGFEYTFRKKQKNSDSTSSDKK